MASDRESKVRKWQEINQKILQLEKEIESLEEDESDLINAVSLGKDSAKIQLRECQEMLSNKRAQLLKAQEDSSRVIPKAKPRFRGTRKNGV